MFLQEMMASSEKAQALRGLFQVVTVILQKVAHFYKPD